MSINSIAKRVAIVAVGTALALGFGLDQKVSEWMG